MLVQTRPDLSKCFIDVYAGCGGFSVGMINAGWKPLAAIEYMYEPMQTYWSNLAMKGWSHLHAQPELLKEQQKKKRHKDRTHVDDWKGETINKIPEIPRDDWTTNEQKAPLLHMFWFDMLAIDHQEFMKTMDLEPGELGAIVGGPPCQGFSHAGNRHIDDPRNEHVINFWNFAGSIQSAFVMMENVPGLLTLGKKKGDKEGPFPAMIREAAKRNGYVLQYEVHDAKDFGVAQTRRRVLFVGVRKDLHEAGKRFEFPKPTHNWDYFDEEKKRLARQEKARIAFNDPHYIAEFSKKLPNGDLRLEPYVTVFEAIGDLSEIPHNYSNVQNPEKYPLGDEHRNSGHWHTDGGYHYVQDGPTGIYYTRNEIDRALKDWGKGHYIKCKSCNQYNIKIRKKCHNCGENPLGLLI